MTVTLTLTRYTLTQKPGGFGIPVPITRPAQAAPVAHFAHSNPSLGNPVLMDIGETRKAKATPDTCRHCRKTGHWAKDCDLRFDVRYMDADELETELENKLATKDVAPMETSGHR